ncbi:hypothetical protein P8452_25642 [Trifolium repens]|nr:hypothetical protein P8452_25642 [Trifolium repens]
MFLSFLLLKTLVHNLFSHFPKHKDTLKNRRKSSTKQTRSFCVKLPPVTFYFTSTSQRNKERKKKNLCLITSGIWFDSVRFSSISDEQHFS